eukprot:2688145-Pleurochrysis_carterae.AAC.8
MHIWDDRGREATTPERVKTLALVDSPFADMADTRALSGPPCTFAARGAPQCAAETSATAPANVLRARTARAAPSARPCARCCKRERNRRLASRSTGQRPARSQFVTT